MGVKPFVKWAGGKRNLCHLIPIPAGVNKYIEPFVGGGAMLFHAIQNYSQFKYFLINDTNWRLVTVYRIIKKDVLSLMALLSELQSVYNSLTRSEKEEFYRKIRDDYNQEKDSLRIAAYFIVLNKICFNGLYRENKKGFFNVPSGKVSKLCLDLLNLKNVSIVLNEYDVKIQSGDFSDCLDGVDCYSFVYFDPPYHPISKTSRFTSYCGNFDETDQIRLRDSFVALHQRGAKLALSNSASNFINELYKDFPIKKIEAARAINSDASKRGKIFELVVTNF